MEDKQQKDHPGSTNLINLFQSSSHQSDLAILNEVEVKLIRTWKLWRLHSLNRALCVVVCVVHTHFDQQGAGS